MRILKSSPDPLFKMYFYYEFFWHKYSFYIWFYSSQKRQRSLDNMEEFQVAHDLADYYFNCHMKDICSFTHSVSTDKLNCFLYNNKNCQVDLLAEINLLSKLPDDFDFSKEGWSKFL